jgi:cytochrome c-type biogenesis protein CcmH/NrfG
MPGWSAVLFVLVAVTLVWTGLSDGGFADTTWGWTALALTWVAIVTVILRPRLEVTALQALFVGGLGASIVLSSLSLAWTDDRALGFADVERDLVYFAAALVAVLLGDRAAPQRLLDGVLLASGAIVAASLAARLSPEQFGLYTNPVYPGRLFYPLGYWNGQGLMAVMTILLAAAVVVSRRGPGLRAAAAALVPLSAVDFYFTESRGAGIALAVGIAAWLAIDPRRLRTSVWLWVSAPWAVIAVWRAHEAPQLIGASYSASSTPAGHRLGWQLLALCLLAAGSVGALAVFEDRIRVPGTLRMAYAGSQALVLAALCIVAIDRYGTPDDMVRSVRSGLSSHMVETAQPSRLLSLSLNGRAQLWSVAWQDARLHPLIGSGTGSYEKRWLLDRSFAANSTSAHSLWLERLAENGIVGLIVLAAAMLAPLAAGVRMRRASHVPGAIAVYVAYLVHTGVDWDWLLPTLTLVAIWTGSALVATDSGRRYRVAAAGRWSVAAVTVVVAVAAALGLAGNLELARGSDAARRGDFRSAVADLTQAADHQPWSAQPWIQIGGARLGFGDVAGAKAAYRRAIDRDPTSWDAWFQLANLLSGDARTRALLKARSLNPRSPEIDHLCLENQEPGCINIRHRGAVTG